MDHRIKSFEAEATSAFGFLRDLGFASTCDQAVHPDRRPFSISVAFRGSDVSIETNLVLEFAGDDNLVTTVITVDGLQELPPTVARKGHELRKALQSHADQVRALLS